MKPIEDVYTGVKQILHNDIEFIICPACGENDACTENYIKGEVLIDALPDIRAFRVPAIRKGTWPNKDGFYRLEQLICNIDNGNLKVEEIERLGDDQTGVFFDVCKKEILCEDDSSCEAMIKPREFICCSATKNVYRIATLWNFLVSKKETEISNE